jgi:hypothetical protein
MKEKPRCGGAFERFCFRSINDGNPLTSQIRPGANAPMRRKGRHRFRIEAEVAVPPHRAIATATDSPAPFRTRWPLSMSGRGASNPELIIPVHSVPDLLVVACVVQSRR